MRKSNTAVNIDTFVIRVDDSTMNQEKIMEGLYFGESPNHLTSKNKELYEGQKRFEYFLEEIDKRIIPEISKEIPIVSSLSELRGRFPNFKEPNYQEEFNRYKETLELLLPAYFPDDPHLVGYIGEEVDILFDS